MTRRINPQTLRGGIRRGLTVKMPPRFSAPATIMDGAQANPPVTMLPPRPPVSFSLLGLKVAQPKGRR